MKYPSPGKAVVSCVKGAALLELSISVSWLLTLAVLLTHLSQTLSALDGIVRSNYEVAVYGASLPTAAQQQSMDSRAQIINRSQAQWSSSTSLSSSAQLQARTLTVSQGLSMSGLFWGSLAGNVSTTVPSLLLSNLPSPSNDFQNPNPRYDCAGQRCNLLVNPSCGLQAC